MMHLLEVSEELDAFKKPLAHCLGLMGAQKRRRRNSGWERTLKVLPGGGGGGGGAVRRPDPARILLL
jgi:hypothetical protein